MGESHVSPTGTTHVTELWYPINFSIFCVNAIVRVITTNILLLLFLINHDGHQALIQQEVKMDKTGSNKDIYFRQKITTRAMEFVGGVGLDRTFISIAK
jgi:hypothetical protein